MGSARSPLLTIPFRGPRSPRARPAPSASRRPASPRQAARAPRLRRGPGPAERAGAGSRLQARPRPRRPRTRAHARPWFGGATRPGRHSRAPAPPAPAGSLPADQAGLVRVISPRRKAACPWKSLLCIWRGGGSGLGCRPLHAFLRASPTGRDGTRVGLWSRLRIFAQGSPHPGALLRKTAPSSHAQPSLRGPPRPVSLRRGNALLLLFIGLPQMRCCAGTARLQLSLLLP